MLKSVCLKNYKCFKSGINLEIAPLTLLCGINSSGKSSIIKSILMMKQSAEGRFSDASVVLSGDYVDCGTFDEVISDGSEGKNEFLVGNSFRISNHKLDTIGKYIRKQDANFFNELRRMYSNIPGDIKFFQFELTLGIRKSKDNLNEFSKYISNSDISIYKISIDAFDINEKKIDSCSGYISFENNEDEEKHNLSWKNIPGFAKALNSFENYTCTCSFNGLSMSNIFAYDMPNRVKSVVPNILSITRIVSSQYDGINYIAPLRNTPKRKYIIKKDVNSVGLSGEDTPILLAKIKNKRITTELFCPYNNSFSVNHNGYVNADYHSILQEWLDYFEVGNLDVQGENGVINVNIGKHNISDIGFGMSQLLPILTQGIVMDKEQTLIIEQPEIHLHPKMELQMADFLIQIAKSNRNVIVETHSDHIVNRLVRRVMEDYALNDLVKIYFVEKVGNESVIHGPVEINQYKGTKDEHADFFTQYTDETSQIIDIGLNNILNKSI